ncbi:hypothetical protein L7F22_006252 [Adiantum nelumboides]|nr:hypothetical protein [Adiantum nelumboides]
MLVVLVIAILSPLERPFSHGYSYFWARECCWERYRMGARASPCSPLAQPLHDRLLSLAPWAHTALTAALARPLLHSPCKARDGYGFMEGEGEEFNLHRSLLMHRMHAMIFKQEEEEGPANAMVYNQAKEEPAYEIIVAYEIGVSFA